MASAQWWLIGYLPITGPAQWVPFQGTQAQAQAKVNLAVNGKLEGPYPSKAAAQAAIKKLPTSLQQTPTGSEQAVQQAVDNAVPGLSQIGTFFSDLSQASTWIRVAEVLLGLGLIIVGLAHLASGTAAGRAALKAGKAAAIL